MYPMSVAGTATITMIAVTSRESIAATSRLSSGVTCVTADPTRSSRPGRPHPPRRQPP
jgi:hypothetical protein